MRRLLVAGSLHGHEDRDHIATFRGQRTTIHNQNNRNWVTGQEHVVPLRKWKWWPQTRAYRFIFQSFEKQIKRTQICWNKETPKSNKIVSKRDNWSCPKLLLCANDIRPPTMHLNRSSHIQRIQSARLKSESCFPPSSATFRGRRRGEVDPTGLFTSKWSSSI